MHLKELAMEYKCQADILDRKVAECIAELPNCQGEQLYKMRKKVKVLSDMQLSCITTYNLLLHYYDED